MKFYLLFVLCILLACKSRQDGNENYKYDPDKVYKLKLNPSTGSTYQYDISNESDMQVEINDNKVESESRTNVGINYFVNKDSAGKLLLISEYDKIQLYTKKNEVETELDASNASFTLDPVEKMLGILKGATIKTTVGPTGEILHISGYKELGEKVIASLGAMDPSSKTMAMQQWEKVIGSGMIKKNFDQLFKVFPDSAVQLNDTWRITTKEEGELPFIVKNNYTLKAINSEIAIISCEGKITSDNTADNPGGYGHATSTLEGEQEAQYELEVKTGMLLSCKIKTIIKGTVKVMEREVPVTIKSSVEIKGKRNMPK